MPGPMPARWAGLPGMTSLMVPSFCTTKPMEALRSISLRDFWYAFCNGEGVSVKVIRQPPRSSPAMGGWGEVDSRRSRKKAAQS